MEYTTVENPAWSNTEASTIDCNVVFTGRNGAIRFTASAHDVEPHGVQIFNRCVAGDFGLIAAYVPMEVSPKEVSLSAEAFYSMLDHAGKLDQFLAEIENVVPAAKKLTCRNQFNNSISFVWDMALIQLVAPKVWGETWQHDIASAWIAAAGS